MRAAGLAQGCALASNLVVAIVLARWLKPAGRGEFVLASLVAFIITTVLAFGLPVSSTTFILKRRYPIPRLAGTALSLALVRSAISGLLVSVVWLSWARFRELGPGMLLLVWGICAAETFYILARGLLYSLNRMNSWALVDIGMNLVFLAAVMLLWRSGVAGLARYALLAWFGARLAALACAMCAANQAVTLRPHFDLRVAVALLKFGFRNFLSDLAWTLGPRVDQCVVGAVLTSAHLGIYSIAAGLTEKLTTLLLTIPTGLYRFQASAGDVTGGAELLTARGLRVSLALAGVLGGLVLSVAWWLVPVFFGCAFSGAVLPLMILSLGTVVGTGFHVLRGWMTGCQMKPELSALFGAGLIAVSVTANLLLTPRLGITGAALAQTGAGLVAFIPFAAHFRRKSGLGFGQILLVQGQDISVLVRIGKSLMSREPDWRRPAAQVRLEH